MAHQAAASHVETWPIRKEDYELKEVIGQGSTAVVQVAKCLPRNEVCAIKRISLEITNQEELLLKEIRAMRQCKHPNLITFYQAFVVKTEVWLVMKLLAHGSVLDLIKHRIMTNQHTQGVFDEIAIATMLKDVLKALEYLHKNGQIHRDVKSGNILLADDGSIQLADLGVSSCIATAGERSLDRQATRHTFVGTPCWMAPEVMEQADKGYDEKADIWSFGILAIELATGKAPYHKYPAMKVLILTLQNDPPGLDTCVSDKNMTKKYTKQFRKLIEMCLQRDPAKRPSASQLLKDPFFKKAKRPEYIHRTLLTDAPKLRDRGKKPKRVPGSSGRLHRNEDGDWEWSDDEYDTTTKVLTSKLASSSLHEERANECRRHQPISSLTRKESMSSTLTNITGPATAAAVANVMTDMNIPTTSTSSDVIIDTIPSPIQQQTTTEGDGEPAAKQQNQPAATVNEGKKFNFNLRLRTDNKQNLQDIKFVFIVGQDTPDGVSQELVAAGLIEGRDKVIVAANVSKLVDSPVSQGVKIPLSGNLQPNQLADEKNLIGFAYLTILSS